jgi:hypothetical protein
MSSTDYKIRKIRMAERALSNGLTLQVYSRSFSNGLLGQGTWEIGRHRQIGLYSLVHSGLRALMRIQPFVLAIATLIYFFAQANLPAMAQAGSTGGTVGKQDKSVSGSEEPARPKSRSHKSISASVEARSKSSGCGNVVGAYKWALGTTTVFKADGTTANSSGNQGNWTCANGRVTIIWNSGGFVDRLTPTSNGYSVVDNIAGQFDAPRM